MHQIACCAKILYILGKNNLKASLFESETAINL